MTTISLDSLRDIHLPPEPALVALLSPWSMSAITIVLLGAIFLAIRHQDGKFGFLEMSKAQGKPF